MRTPDPMGKHKKVILDHLDRSVCIGCEQHHPDVVIRHGWPLCHPCDAELARRQAALN